MPPPKIIGQVLQEKRYCEKEIQRRKNKKKQCSQREKRNTFLFEILAAYKTRYSPEDPLRAKKKNKVTFPVKFKLVPSERSKPLFWFRSNTETETVIGRYFWLILTPILRLFGIFSVSVPDTDTEFRSDTTCPTGATTL